MLLSFLLSAAQAFPKDGLEVEAFPWNDSYEHTLNVDGLVIGKDTVFPHMVTGWTGGRRHRQGLAGFIYEGRAYILRYGSSLSMLSVAHDDLGLVFTFAVDDECDYSPGDERRMRKAYVFAKTTPYADSPGRCPDERVARRR